MTCAEIDPLLLEFVEGELPDDRAGAVRTHIRDCAGCAAKARETRNLLGDFGVAASIEHRAWSSQDGTRPSAPPTPVGRPVRLGDFEILDELGRGGMGIVYRARQVTLNRIVALKVLQAGVVMNDRAVARFQKEAQAAARLHHTNIVPVYAQGEQDGFFYYAMELIQGEALDRVLNRSPSLVTLTDLPLDVRTAEVAQTATHPLAVPDTTVAAGANATTQALPALPATAGGAPDAAEPDRGHAGGDAGISVHLTRRHSEYKRIARLVAEVADALHHAHQQGIVHRDIKPQNLLLGQDDRLHITDFGLARLLDEPHLTLSAEIIGTPSYMSPEQIRGVRDEIDQRTDIYSLGVTLYQMLTLRTPFTGESYDQIITRILKQEPKSPRRLDPHIPADLETICLRSMEKDAKRRFSSAKDMADDLRRYAGDFPIVSRRIGPVGKLVRLVKRHPARSAAVIAVAMVLALLPIVTQLLVTAANQGIRRAENLLLEDYHEKADEAQALLGPRTRLFGNRDQFDKVRALSLMIRDKRTALDVLRDLGRRRPHDEEVRYLLIWGYLRNRDESAAIELLRDAAERGDPESAVALFLKGQVLLSIDPERAIECFDAAALKRESFTQAVLHRVRAMNWCMYYLHDVSFYDEARGAMDTVIRHLHRDDDYSRYIAALAHVLGAECLVRLGRDEAAHKAYDLALENARLAQRHNPKKLRGFAAEWQCHESRGDLPAALAAWDAVDTDAIGPDEWFEYSRYRMRLLFWFGRYAEAEEMRRVLFSEKANYSADNPNVFDGPLFEALLLASGGQVAAARAALQAATAEVNGNAERRLILHLAHTLLGMTPPAELLGPQLDYRATRSAYWTEHWLRTLVGYARGDCTWSDVEIAADAELRAQVGTPLLPDREIPRRIRLQRLMGGARFCHAVRVLAEGRREAAEYAFRVAAETIDGEHWCFRAKLIHEKLRSDPGWPAWLPAVTGTATAPASR